MLIGDERERELEALDLARMGLEAALERLPAESAWRAPFLEAARALGDVDGTPLPTEPARPRTLRDMMREVMREVLDERGEA